MYREPVLPRILTQLFTMDCALHRHKVMGSGRDNTKESEETLLSIEEPVSAISIGQGPRQNNSPLTLLTVFLSRSPCNIR